MNLPGEKSADYTPFRRPAQCHEKCHEKCYGELPWRSAIESAIESAGDMLGKLRHIAAAASRPMHL
jgi:hypothetical protein